MSISRILNRIMAPIARFPRDTNGNIAMIFALALLPILTAVGCAVDYSTAARIKAKLQSAADAAGVAAISYNSAGYTAAMSMTSNGSVSAGVRRVKLANCPGSNL